MENKMFNVPVELFELDKVMINKQKVCKVSFRITDKTGDVTDVFKFPNVEPNYQCIEALQNKIAELKPYLCDIHSISEDHRNKVNITGVECSGSGDSAAFTIHGVNISDSEQRMPFKTHRVLATGGYYGFEVEVENIIADLQILTHAYIFEDQRAQLAFGLANANTDESDDDQIEDAQEIDASDDDPIIGNVESETES